MELLSTNTELIIEMIFEKKWYLRFNIKGDSKCLRDYLTIFFSLDLSEFHLSKMLLCS